MSSHHFDFGRVQAPAAQHGPVVKQLSDIDPTVLIQIAAWLEQNPVSVPWSRVRGVPALLKALAGQWTAVGGGRATVHFSGAALSDTVTVTHGLGLIPTDIQLTGEDSGGSVIEGVVGVTSDTTFTCWFRDVQGNSRGLGNLVFNWLALG